MDSGMWTQMDIFPWNGPHSLEGGILRAETHWARSGRASQREDPVMNATGNGHLSYLQEDTVEHRDSRDCQPQEKHQGEKEICGGSPEGAGGR